MKKVLNISLEEKIAKVLKQIYEKPNSRFIFSKEFVCELSNCASYGKNNVKTVNGDIQIYGLENEKGDTVVMTFLCDLVTIGFGLANDKMFEGYELKSIITVIGKKVETNSNNNEIILIP